MCFAETLIETYNMSVVIYVSQLIPWIRGPRETKERKGRGEGTSGRTRQASVRPHQLNDKVQNLDFLVIG